MNLSNGVMSAIGLFETLDQGQVYCVLTLHRLAVDEVSWGIVLPDLEAALSHEEVMEETQTVADSSQIRPSTWSVKASIRQDGRSKSTLANHTMLAWSLLERIWRRTKLRHVDWLLLMCQRTCRMPSSTL